MTAIYALIVGLLVGATIGAVAMSVIVMAQIDRHREAARRARDRMYRAQVDQFERQVRGHNARVAAKQHLGTPYIDGHRVLADNERWSRRAS